MQIPNLVIKPKSQLSINGCEVSRPTRLGFFAQEERKLGIVKQVNSICKCKGDYDENKCDIFNGLTQFKVTPTGVPIYGIFGYKNWEKQLSESYL